MQELKKEYLHVLQKVCIARETVPSIVADNYLKKQMLQIPQDKDYVKAPKFQPLDIYNVTKVLTKQESESISCELNELLTRHKHLQDAIALKKKLELNETYQVLTENLQGIKKSHNNHDDISTPPTLTRNGNILCDESVNRDFDTPILSNVGSEGNSSTHSDGMDIDDSQKGFTAVVKELSPSRRQSLKKRSKTASKTPSPKKRLSLKTASEKRGTQSAGKLIYHSSMLPATPGLGNSTPVRLRRSARKSTSKMAM